MGALTYQVQRRTPRLRSALRSTESYREFPHRKAILRSPPPIRPHIYQQPNFLLLPRGTWSGRAPTTVPRSYKQSAIAMSQKARIEEADSDPEEVAPSDSNFDQARFARESIISPSIIPGPTAGSGPTRPPLEQRREIPKQWQCLYPVYFDKTRSRAEGRKVGSELAVENPLARDILDAVQMLGLRVGFEPEKLHPKDWANPGRVRVMLKDENGKPVDPKIKNSTSPFCYTFLQYLPLVFGQFGPLLTAAPEHHLFILVAQYLKAHPTTEESPYRLRIRGLPMPEKLPPPPPAPRGWKIGKILPIHSPAYSGGGVSDNPFKDAMAEMQNLQQNLQGMPGFPGMPGMPPMPGMGESSGAGGERKKKEKKKGKA